MIHEIIRKARRSQEITQKEFARMLGVNVTTINRFEKGKQGMKQSNIEKAFEILNIEL